LYFLNDEERNQLHGAEQAAFQSTVRTQVVSAYVLTDPQPSGSGWTEAI
jgi:hypothetical protein